jgi:hypothetical protein
MKHHSIIILLVLLFVAGCNKQVGMTGTVVFSDDGSPVPFGNVILSTPTFQSRGELNKQGQFTMGSFGTDDGLPPGTYTVSVQCIESGGDTGSYSIIDPKYSNPATSGLEITVSKAIKDYEIKVERNPKPKSGK